MYTPTTAVASTEVLDYLHSRAGQWVTSDQLSIELGIYEEHPTNPRTRRLISKLRNEGHPIVSGPDGYCYTTNQDLIRKAVFKLVARGAAIMAVASRLARHG